MTRNGFLRLLEQELDLDEGYLNPDRSLGEGNFWDSMSALIYISLVDEHLQFTVSAEQIARCETVGGLLDLVDEKLSP
jgi:acyl carrier protein